MSNDVQLTNNAVKSIYGSQQCSNPVLQIVDVKKVVPNPGQAQAANQADRYRYTLLFYICQFLYLIVFI